jgi:hypothetical protein
LKASGSLVESVFPTTTALRVTLVFSGTTVRSVSADFTHSALLPTSSALQLSSLKPSGIFLASHLPETLVFFDPSDGFASKHFTDSGHPPDSSAFCHSFVAETAFGAFLESRSLAATADAAFHAVVPSNRHPAFFPSPGFPPSHSAMDGSLSESSPGDRPMDSRALSQAQAEKRPSLPGSPCLSRRPPLDQIRAPRRGSRC